MFPCTFDVFRAVARGCGRRGAGGMPDLEVMPTIVDVPDEQPAAVGGGDAPKPGDGDGADETASLRSALQKERDARKAADRERKALAQRLGELEQAGKPEAERLAAERDALRAELDATRQQMRSTRGKAAVLSAATEANAVTPGVIYRAIVGDLQFDDDGEPTNVPQLLAELRKEAPALFRPVTGKADAAATTAAVAPGGDWIKRGLAARRG